MPCEGGWPPCAGPAVSSWSERPRWSCSTGRTTATRPGGRWKGLRAARLGGLLQRAAGVDAGQVGTVVARGVEIVVRLLAVGGVGGSFCEGVGVGRLALQSLLDPARAVGLGGDAGDPDAGVGDR